MKIKNVERVIFDLDIDEYNAIIKTKDLIYTLLREMEAKRIDTLENSSYKFSKEILRTYYQALIKLSITNYLEGEINKDNSITFKQRLAKEYPEYIINCEPGGCRGCPYDYGYETNTESEKNCKSHGGKGCEYCWNRVITENKEERVAHER